jgi:hypothetical protein
MRRYRIFGIASLLPLLAITAIIIIPGRSQEQKPQIKTHGRKFDENRFPIADYTAADPSDPKERSKRQEKGKKYDKSAWRIYPETTSSMARVDYVDPNLPALPLTQSSAVIVGPVTDAKAYLSNDKTGVYSAFTVQIDEVLKNASSVPLSSVSSIEVERDGGRVRFPGGRILIYTINSQDMPVVGLRYVFFLTNPHGQSDFQILTAYELREGKVYPLDDLPNLYRYENADELNFLRELRNSIANP